MKYISFLIEQLLGKQDEVLRGSDKYDFVGMLAEKKRETERDRERQRETERDRERLRETHRN